MWKPGDLSRVEASAFCAGSPVAAPDFSAVEAPSLVRGNTRVPVQLGFSPGVRKMKERIEMNFMDLALARRLEMASAISGKACAEGAQRLHPELDAAAEEIAGGIAVYAGIDSPVTQALGIGLNGPVDSTELDRLEEFFHSRKAPVAIELCPLAGLPLYEALAKREYRLIEVSSVLVRELSSTDEFAASSNGV